MTSAEPALAQPDAGAVGKSVIIGTVIDTETKKPLPDVVVTATSPSLVGEQTVVTDANGNYRIPQLPAGTYTLRFEKEAFKPYVRNELQLLLNRTIRVNVEMLPESFSSTMPIMGSPPTIDVGSSNHGVNVDQEFIKRIAVARPESKGGATRSFESLAARAPSGDGDPSSNNDRARAPSWALPHMLVVPDGTPQTVYRAPQASAVPTPQPAPERTVAPQGQRFFDMYFKGYGVNPTVDTEEERFSTFSVDTDTASYTLTRAYLERGALPDEQAVRVEEFVNTFDYGYANAPDAPFSVNVEGFPSPARKGYQVVHIGVKARDVSRAGRKPGHLVFVIDVSGSMAMENRLGLVKRSLRLLVDALDERDWVSIVVYGTTAHQVLAPTNATQKDTILSAIDSVQSEGSTNAQAGMELGYALAASHMLKGGINRVILCSDGVANNGITEADGIWALVKEKAAAGITLSTVGFGMGNYNDVLMERLAQVGEGNYSYVDKLEEARRIFVQNLTGTLQVVAKDVKLQVEFDRKTVSRYRLIGYENRLLTQQQFNDDRVDAGEVGAGHAVTALYEVKLRDPAQTNFGTLRIRYKAPEGGSSKLIEKAMPVTLLRPAYEKAASPTRLSYVAAAFAEKLRGSYWARPLTYDALVSLWEELGTPLKARADVVELGELIRLAKKLDRREDRFESFAPVRTMDADRVPTLK
ncbi:MULTISPECIES: YfbK domain-containing protein [unclassified Corallococcus]|uniref:YfbK domain-containing protein n=1 Tax=unclassified Corallococcus TaxID=2685029 RepID=UPI001F5D7C11|nr:MULTISPECIES: von Willebrand factor type A domain-containing protein [unclassified Corallococcus]WAS89371.1 von Willebrand factor type A domain-containing protein [Corallococcus sp. NCRR]